MGSRNDYLRKIVSELEEIEKLLPEEKKDNLFGNEVITKPYRMSLVDAKHSVRMFYADGDNSLASQVTYELEHLEYLKQYIEQRNEDNGLKEAIYLAVEGLCGALKILRYYKIKEELDGEK